MSESGRVCWPQADDRRLCHYEFVHGGWGNRNNHIRAQVGPANGPLCPQNPTKEENPIIPNYHPHLPYLRSDPVAVSLMPGGMAGGQHQ